jgi:hypothetical protein
VNGCTAERANVKGSAAKPSSSTIGKPGVNEAKPTEGVLGREVVVL